MLSATTLFVMDNDKNKPKKKKIGEMFNFKKKYLSAFSCSFLLK